MNRYDCAYDNEDECAYMRRSEDGAYIAYDDFIKVLDSMWKAELISRDLRNYAVSRFNSSSNQPYANGEKK